MDRYEIPPRRFGGGGGGSSNSSPALGAQSRRRKTPPRPADYKLQIIIIGSRGVGKTSLMERFTDDTFCEACKSTVGEEGRGSSGLGGGGGGGVVVDVVVCVCFQLLNTWRWALAVSWHLAWPCFLCAADIRTYILSHLLKIKVQKKWHGHGLCAKDWPVSTCWLQYSTTVCWPQQRHIHYYYTPISRHVKRIECLISTGSSSISGCLWFTTGLKGLIHADVFFFFYQLGFILITYLRTW